MQTPSILRARNLNSLFKELKQTLIPGGAFVDII